MGKNQVGFLHEKTGQKTCKISLSLGKQKTLEKKSFVRPSLFSFRFVVWGDGPDALYPATEFRARGGEDVPETGAPWER